MALRAAKIGLNDGLVGRPRLVPKGNADPNINQTYNDAYDAGVQKRIDDEQGVKVADAVHHPSHYTSGSIEVWTAIRDWELNYHRGNVVKYVAFLEWSKV